jgi:SAM-dependent methyltransferase
MRNSFNFGSRNRTAFDRAASNYLQKHLHPPERSLLERWRGRWHEVDMLDLGVGAGRTTYIFCAITRRYVGVDYSPQMIQLCCNQFSEGPSVKFIVGDASDLSFLGDEKFDFVLFSYNGIDYVDHDKRLRVLREICAKLKGPDSLFMFSSHSLHAYPFAFRWTVELSRPIRTLYRLPQDATFNVRLMFHNRRVSTNEVKRRGWAVLNDGAQRFQLSTYYVMPNEQVRQINDAGFDLVEAMNTAGKRIDWRIWQPDHWLYYICRLATPLPNNDSRPWALVHPCREKRCETEPDAVTASPANG